MIFSVCLFSSHRPLELSNIFKDQVKIIAKEGDATLEEIPEAEKIIEEVCACLSLLSWLSVSLSHFVSQFTSLFNFWGIIFYSIILFCYSSPQYFLIINNTKKWSGTLYIFLQQMFKKFLNCVWPCWDVMHWGAKE